MSLVINSLEGRETQDTQSHTDTYAQTQAHTQTHIQHTHTDFMDKSNFKKPGVHQPVCI